MTRTRSVRTQPHNGGRHCPSLQQRRGCHQFDCHHHQDAAIKEVAMLLPGSLSEIRRVNETSDIRRNLRLKDPEEHPEHDPEREYCVEFEVLKASKACRKENGFQPLKEGDRVCVKCESEALRKNLGWRCQGHGVEGRVTRWIAMGAPYCHGKWIRVETAMSQRCSAKTCLDENYLIFV